MKHPHNINDLLETRHATSLLPDFIGFIFYEKSPRFVGVETRHATSLSTKTRHATSLSTKTRHATFLSSKTRHATSLPEGTKKIGVFVNEPIEKIIETAQNHNLDGIQLHGKESPEDCKQIREKGFLTIKAFNVENEQDFEQTKAYEGVVDFFLFDTKTSPTSPPTPQRGDCLPVAGLPPFGGAGGGCYGGTGMKFDWHILKQYNGNTPFFLSGGICEDDAEEIKNLHLPKLYAVDINSRFEIEPGLKDIEKIKRFIKHLRN